MKDKVKLEYKEMIVQTGLDLLENGMTVGTWGNISIRDPETGLVYISPSGMDYKEIRPEHVVTMTDTTEVVDGIYEPSIEKGMHCAVYRARKDVNAVIHTHPVYSSVFGVLEKEIPAISEDFAQIVGDKIGNALPYKLPGTDALGEVAVEGLGEKNAVLLPSHGALSVGDNIKKAIKVSLVLEKNAQIYLFAKLLGEPRSFEDSEISAMQDFAKNHYGAKNRDLGKK